MWYNRDTKMREVIAMLERLPVTLNLYEDIYALTMRAVALENYDKLAKLHELRDRVSCYRDKLYKLALDKYGAA